MVILDWSQILQTPHMKIRRTWSRLLLRDPWEEVEFVCRWPDEFVDGCPGTTPDEGCPWE